MIICYFGTYSKEEGYTRNRVIIKGLEENGIVIKECHADLWKGRLDKLSGIKYSKYTLSLIPRFIFAYISLLIKFFNIGTYDLMIVGYAGHLDIFLARILNLFRRKPLVFDAFLSLYDTAVNEFKVAKKNSWKAKAIWLIDRYSCLMADKVLLDTQAHIKYFVEEFKLSYTKFIALPVGQDNQIFKPQGSSKVSNTFNILFFGNYTPLHGAEYILRAAKKLEPYPDVHFTLVGDSPLYGKIHSLAEELSLKNVTFIRSRLAYSLLKEYIASADICLGVFGETLKANNVVPCKIYDCLAMAKSIITSNSAAAREILTDKENILFCKPKDADSIADAIILLKDNPLLRDKIAYQAYQLFCEKFTPKHIAERLIAELKKEEGR